MYVAMSLLVGLWERLSSKPLINDTPYVGRKLLLSRSSFKPTERGAMECPKCQGLMDLERFSDFFLVFYAWKCINCGAVIDKTIASNRRNSLAAKPEIAKVSIESATACPR